MTAIVHPLDRRDGREANLQYRIAGVSTEACHRSETHGVVTGIVRGAGPARCREAEAENLGETGTEATVDHRVQVTRREVRKYVMVGNMGTP